MNVKMKLCDDYGFSINNAPNFSSVFRQRRIRSRNLFIYLSVKAINISLDMQSAYLISINQNKISSPLKPSKNDVVKYNLILSVSIEKGDLNDDSQ